MEEKLLLQKDLLNLNACIAKLHYRANKYKNAYHGFS